MLIFPSDTKKFLVSMISTLGLRTELVQVDKVNRRPSDGLMRKCLNFFVILSTSEQVISMKEVQSCIYRFALVDSLCFGLNFA